MIPQLYILASEGWWGIACHSPIWARTIEQHWKVATWNRFCLFWMLLASMWSFPVTHLLRHRQCCTAMAQNGPLCLTFSQYIHNVAMYGVYLMHCNARINSFICRYPQTKAGWYCGHPSIRQSGSLTPIWIRCKQCNWLSVYMYIYNYIKCYLQISGFWNSLIFLEFEHSLHCQWHNMWRCKCVN